DPEQERSMRVAGVLMTSDVEAREKVEQLLTATYRGRTLPIDWTHTSDGQRHEFVLRGLARAEEEQVLRVSWNGTPIGRSEEHTEERRVGKEGRSRCAACKQENTRGG